MNKKIFVVTIIMLAFLVDGYSNNSMTDSFKKIVYGDPIGGLQEEHEYSSGGWFYILLAAAPYLGLWTYQRSMIIAHMWLTVILATYGFLFVEIGVPIPTHVFYLLTVVWLAIPIFRMFSAKIDL